ncbi:hypothetical protein [Streptomyces fractus]|uniref:hypothetical protein n=1 Tax=Streptomyces fractus TaxID=641806 RepID=UPI003CEEE85B
MPYIPQGIATVLLSGRYIRPDGTPLRGNITFSAPTLTLSAADTITVGSAKVELDEDGAFSLTLIATDNASMQPTSWTYQVRETFMHAEGRSYPVKLPQATPVVDLADIAPADPSNGDYVLITGPAGAPGSKILSGTGVPPGASGANGDFYIDTTSGAVKLYGPKASGSWPSTGVALGSGNLVTSVNTLQGAVNLGAAEVGAMASTNGKTTSSLTVDGNAGSYRPIRLQSGGVDRWQIQTDGVAETGASAGSNLRISARNDDGTDAGLAVYVNRATRKTAFGGSTPFGDAQVTSYGAVGIRDVATDPVSAASGVQVYSKGGKTYVRQGDGSILTLGTVASTKSAVFPSPTSGSAFVVWRAPQACTVTAVRGYRTGGTGATINASKSGGTLLATDLSLSTADTWMAGPTLQNTAMAAGDSLVLAVTGVTGTPSAVTVQVDVLQGA